MGLGLAVGFAGDVDADGYDDLLFGVELGSDAALSAGQAYLLFGTGL